VGNNSPRTYLRLIGLNSVTLKHDRRGFIIPSAGDIKIPMFRLSQFEGIGNFSRGDCMVFDSERIMSDHVIQAAKAEQLRFDNVRKGQYE
jgi:hypothetical protein